MPEVSAMAAPGVVPAVLPAAVTDEVEVGEVSPEVVLIDPDLAASARPLLIPHEQPPKQPAEGATKEEDRSSLLPLRPAVAQPDSRAIQARQRLLEAGIASDVLGSMVPRRRRLRRRATLIPAISAASSVGVLVLQLYLGQGTL